MEYPIIVAVLNHAQGTLDLIEVNHLQNWNAETIEEYLHSALDYNNDIDWMLMPEAGAVRFHSPSDGWVNMPGPGKRKGL
jgi:hypothetical protein